MITEEITIDSSLELTWDLITDPYRLGEWVTIHKELQSEPPLPLQEGTHFQQALKIMRFTVSVEWLITELKPLELVKWQGSGPAGSTAEILYSLSKAEQDKKEVIKFTYQNNFSWPGGMFGKIANKTLLDRYARHEARRSLQKLRKLLEVS